MVQPEVDGRGTMRRRHWFGFLALAALFLSACASLQGRDPLQVTIAGVEPLEGQGMEVRMLVKLRVQNPNEQPIEYDGVALSMEVQGKTFATGVSDQGGNVPRFGEAVIDVPVTISAFSLVRQAMGMAGAGADGKIRYAMKGKLSGTRSGTYRFTSKGDFDMPVGGARENIAE
jgi:LEA14-like dessication related protein